MTSDREHPADAGIVAHVSDAFGPMSPVLALNGQPAAWIEGPMLVLRADREFWAQRMQDVG